MNETFDIFYLETLEDMICYQKVILLNNFSDVCTFKQHLNQTEFTYDLVNEKINIWKNNSLLIVLDNSPFPSNGASGNQEILFESSYIITINPSNTFYFWTEIRKYFT